MYIHEEGLVLKLRRVRVFWTGDRSMNIRGWGGYQGCLGVEIRITTRNDERVELHVTSFYYRIESLELPFKV